MNNCNFQPYLKLIIGLNTTEPEKIPEKHSFPIWSILISGVANYRFFMLISKFLVKATNELYLFPVLTPRHLLSHRQWRWALTP